MIKTKQKQKQNKTQNNLFGGACNSLNSNIPHNNKKLYPKNLTRPADAKYTENLFKKKSTNTYFSQK